MISNILCGLDAISDYLGLSKANVRKEIKAGRLTCSLHHCAYRTTRAECDRWALTKSNVKEVHQNSRQNAPGGPG
jgi:hypothetical protein